MIEAFLVTLLVVLLSAVMVAAAVTVVFDWVYDIWIEPEQSKE